MKIAIEIRIVGISCMLMLIAQCPVSQALIMLAKRIIAEAVA